MALRLAVIGLWGHEVYAQSLLDHPATELVAIGGYPGAEPAMHDRLARLRAAWPHAAWHPDPRGLLRREQVDLVLIMTPPRLTAELCAASLALGHATVSEKPVAGSPEQAALLARAVAASDAGYTACLPLTRYGEPFVAAARRVAAGELGPLRRISFRYLARGGPQYTAAEPHWQDPQVLAPALCGGEAAMFCGYGVLALEGLSGRRIRRVSASLGGSWYASYRAAAMEDLAHLAVELEGGLAGAITVGRTPEPGFAPDIALTVTGEHGTLAWSQDVDGPPESAGTAEFIEDVVQMALTGREPALSGRDALQTALVLAAAYRSAAMGRPVDVEPLPPG